MTSKSKDFDKDKKGNLKILVTNVESLSALTPPVDWLLFNVISVFTPISAALEY